MSESPEMQHTAGEARTVQTPTSRTSVAQTAAGESPEAESAGGQVLPDLLVKAVRMLPSDEQDSVLRILLDQHTATWPPHRGVQSPLLPALAQAGWGLFRTPERGSGTLRMVPVRLSAEQHDELKQWCEANDFSMAVVIRGLVDRFLDSQRRPDRPR
jgi:hypothetical protein